jgi:hypothetical protein
MNLIFDNAVLYNTPDTVYHRTAVRMKRHVAPMLEEAKKIEASFVYSRDRLGRTLHMGDMEPVEGWEYSVDPWPGKAVREMSPLSSVDEEDVVIMERELVALKREIGNSNASIQGASSSQRRNRR